MFKFYTNYWTGGTPEVQHKQHNRGRGTRMLKGGRKWYYMIIRVAKGLFRHRDHTVR